MKVACIQLSSSENYNKNIKEILNFINKAIKNKSDFIITPETSSIITSDKKKLNYFSYEMQKDPLVKSIKEICKKYKKWILIGSLPIKDKKKLRNRSILIGPRGKIICYYDKINMFDVKISKKEQHNESKTFKPGNKLVTANLPWGRLGLTICYDLRFPELYRTMAKKGASFLTVPANYLLNTRKRHWHSLLRARAIENFCYIFAPAQYGTHYNGIKVFGHSMIISPDGKILKELKKGEGVIVQKIDPKLPLILRSKIPSLNKN